MFLLCEQLLGMSQEEKIRGLITCKLFKNINWGYSEKVLKVS